MKTGKDGIVWRYPKITVPAGTELTRCYDNVPVVMRGDLPSVAAKIIAEVHPAAQLPAEVAEREYLFTWDCLLYAVPKDRAQEVG